MSQVFSTEKIELGKKRRKPFNSAESKPEEKPTKRIKKNADGSGTVVKVEKSSEEYQPQPTT